MSLLYIVDPAVNAQWSRIENLIEQEATSEAKKLCRVWAQKIKSRFSGGYSRVDFQNDNLESVSQLVEEDKNIRFLVLASSANNEEPGPLIKALTGKKIKIYLYLWFYPGLSKRKRD